MVAGTPFADYDADFTPDTFDSCLFVREDPLIDTNGDEIGYACGADYDGSDPAWKSGVLGRGGSRPIFPTIVKSHLSHEPPRGPFGGDRISLGRMIRPYGYRSPRPDRSRGRHRPRALRAERDLG